ncbi:hypothetical protein EWM64_g2395 [Hericium alpestre]|uniref:Uncharacterized protein n=1 Tax=Hericium alpestre TaxID=135208 RepID=A0A4Z0A5H1_9AGAM|nr:hypothetical protein EWM64_g2395 [Hericium alpestre]
MPALPDSAGSPPENPYDEDHYRAMLATTGDRTVFQVGGIDQDLCIPPPASLDLEVGPYGEHASGVDTSRFESFFSDVDFSIMPEADFRDLANSAFSQPADSPASNSNSPSFFGAPMHGQDQASTSDYGADMMQYLNTEAESSTRFVSFDEHARTQSLTAPLSMSNALNVDFNGSTHASGYAQETTFVPYAPPAGASNAGTRRVAGSWKKAAIPDSPVQSRSSSWAVPS